MSFFSPHRYGPVSLARLTFFSLAGVTLLLVVTSSVFFANISRLERNFAASNEQFAHQELTEALTLMENHMLTVAKALAGWDETRQQLEDPTYYAYWRNSRVLSSGLLPDTTDAIELYDVNGRTLSKESREGEATMPAHIGQDNLRLALARENGHEHFILFFPIFSDTGLRHRIGYGGLKLDFNAELRTLRRFLYVDMASVHLTAQDTQMLSLDQAIRHLAFKTQPSAEILAFKSLIYRVMYQVAAIVLIGILLAYFFVVLLVAKPLRRLSEHIDAMRTGRGGLLSEAYRGPVPVAELENVRISLNDYQSKLDHMHVNLANKNEELWKLAHHDPLTGIFNRRAFEEDWGALTRPALTSINVAFLLFDCDHFKTINDTYGHHVGDQVLQGIAEALYVALRTGDRLYRMGGDEFATILYETDIALATRVAERCIDAVTAHDFAAYGMFEPVRISIGIAHSHDAASAALLHKHADLAMYHAKRPGSAKVAVYAESLAHSSKAMFSSPETAAVYAAIANPDLLEMHYQKIVLLPAAEVDYFEALVRIRYLDSLLHPASIFSVVEAKRLEIEFDLAVLARIRQDLTGGKLPVGTGISINISGMSIVTAQIIDKLLALGEFLDRYKLVIEITETSLITQISHASANLNRLRKAGFVIALDDFGSGYSSLRYLSTMPVDVIKFDISMVHCLDGEDRQRVIVENLAKLISAAGFKLVAEGIESIETLQRVTELGFTHAQGFYLGRPEALKR
ncbi:MAG: bifunctional diguanylate cyclase/phosphodiesterase [Burkholderiales bacterium]|nr:bifunctional diguanylate cyclase/phosphodiesterase [Burkholderiales bacterium]